MATFAPPTPTPKAKPADRPRPRPAAAPRSPWLGAAAQLETSHRTLSGGPIQRLAAPAKPAGGLFGRIAKGVAGLFEPAPKPANRTGLPDRLKAGVEAQSGLAMDDVRVHRSSPEPAKLGALAYTQGSDIHLGPGQDEHLPHEAWHVVQQKQGRVKATTQMKGVAVNAEAALESEADRMGQAASRMSGGRDAGRGFAAARAAVAPAGVVQPKLIIKVDKSTIEIKSYAGSILDIYALAFAKYYDFAAARLKAWIADDVDRTFDDYQAAIDAAEAPAKAAHAVAEFAKAIGVTSTNKGPHPPEADTKLDILRSDSFQTGLENAMKTQLVDYSGSSADFVKSHITSRVNAYASQVLKTGNCGELAEISYWKLMEATKDAWVGRISLYPRKQPGGSGYDHGFDILSEKEFAVGVNPDVSGDSIVVDGWYGYRVLLLDDFLNTNNPYSASLTRANLNVRRVEKTIGFEILDSKLKAAADATIEKLAPGMK